jgi:cobalamin biosynthesis protein CbiG
MSRPSSTPSPSCASSAVPRSLVLGIGCRRGVSLGQLDEAVRAALGARSIGEVERVATILSKATEPALIEFCTRYELALVAFSSDAIDACMRTRETLVRSSAARAYVGVDGVSEPCALLATPGGTLIVPKHAFGGVTVAIAAAETAASSDLRQRATHREKP